MAGLPITPIGNPGEEALKGAMNPPASNDIYFMTIDKQGTMGYGSNDAEYQANIKKMCANGVLSGDELPEVKAAVLGKPIAHSLSPVIHNAGYAAAGLTGWSYTAIECAEAELPDLVAGLGPDWAGLSLTMPLKQAALAVAGEVSPVAAAAGAANTLVRRPDGSWYADNTDVAGHGRRARRRRGVDRCHGHRAGRRRYRSGGDRRGGRAGRGRGDGGGPAGRGGRRAPPGGQDARHRPACGGLARRRSPGRPGRAAGAGGAAPGAFDADVVISTVPKGVADPLASAVAWRPGTVLFDALYDPWPTPLAVAAAAAGCRVVSGLDLLLAQAVGQFEQFTGVTAPVEAMRSALRAARAPA